jgi:hypothetical protein
MAGRLGLQVGDQTQPRQVKKGNGGKFGKKASLVATGGLKTRGATKGERKAAFKSARSRSGASRSVAGLLG